MTRAVLLLVAGALLVGRSGEVRADEDPLARPTSSEARAALERGEALYNLQKWDEAIVELEKGALLEPDLPLWFLSLGQAHRKAGRYERARWYFERFLSRIDGVAGTDEIAATVRGLIADMNAAESRPPTELAPTVSPPAEGEGPPARSGWTTRRKIALGAGVGGLFSVGAGAMLSVRAQGLEDDAAALCPTITCADADEANELARRADTTKRNAAIAYGVGGAAIVGSVVLWFLGAPEHGRDRAVAVTPVLSSSAAGVDVRLRF